MLSESVCQATQANGGEEVDSKASVLWRIPREDTSQVRRQKGIQQELVQLCEAQVLDELLEEDLDKDATRGVRILFIQPDVLQHTPVEGVGMQQMGEELAQVAEGIRLEPVHFGELLNKALVKEILVESFDHAQSLSKKGRKPEESASLQAALDDHIGHFKLLPRLDVHPHDLVSALFKVEGGHDHQVDLSSEGQYHALCHILHFLRGIDNAACATSCCFIVTLVLLATLFASAILVFLVVAKISQYGLLHGLIALFMC